MDIPFAKNWALSLEVWYIDIETNATVSTDVGDVRFKTRSTLSSITWVSPTVLNPFGRLTYGHMAPGLASLWRGLFLAADSATVRRSLDGRLSGACGE